MRTQRHTKLVGSAAALLVALVVVVAPARGQSGFVPGSGDVKASFLTVSPEYAGLSVGVTIGETLADFQNDVARAQARAMNIGVIGTTATAEKCDGGDPDLHKDDLPTTVRVDSREEGAEAGTTDYWPILPRDLPYQFNDAKEENGGIPNLQPPPDSPLRADFTTLFARANTQPEAFSTSDSATTYIGGVGKASGGYTETTTRIEGDRRIGEARVTIPEISLGDGAVVFHDLEWRTRQTTGPDAPADATFEGSFRMGGITVGGATYGWPDDAADAFNEQARKLLTVVNTALAPTGLIVTFPQLRQDGGHAAVTPLEVKIDRPPLGRDIFSLFPPEVYEGRQQLFDRMIEATCKSATYITVADILLATPAGAGTTRLSFGGADAFTEGTQYADPFAFTPRGSTPFVAPVGADQGGFAGDTAVQGLQVTQAPTNPSSPPDGMYATPGTGLAAGLTAPGSKSATAAIVGIIGLIAVLGVALLDFLRPRRGISVEETAG